MSRIGKKPVPIPNGVDVKVEGGVLKVKGPKGSLERTLTGPVEVKVDAAAKQALVSRTEDTKKGREFHGLWRALLNGMVIGVTEGYSKTLDIVGIGYKAEIAGQSLKVSVGYAVPYELTIPAGVKVDAKRGSVAGVDFEITVSGIDKELVGQFAASIRRIKKPDLYKGKGIRYRGEYVRKLAGKTFGTAGG